MTRLVIGLGHPDRGDDAAGLLVAERVGHRRPADLMIDRVDGSPVRLLSRWSDDDEVVVADALRSVEPPGTILRFDARDGPLPGNRGGGSHDASLRDAVELARALGRLPRTLILYGVVGARFGLGDRPTPDVLAAVEALANRIVDETTTARPPLEAS